MPPESVAYSPVSLPDKSGEQPVYASSDIAQELREALGERNWQHWFEGRVEFRLHEGELKIAVGSPFLQSWMQRRFGRRVSDTARQLASVKRVVWEVDSNLTSTHASASDAQNEDARKAGEQERADAAVRGHDSGEAQAGNHSTDSNASPTVPAKPRGRRYARLEEFVAGDCNELAFTAARHVSDRPGERFNPLYLHGPVGTGKTHLAEAVHCEVRRQHSGLKSLFMTCESFANQFTHALRSHSLPGFRQRFRGLDLLVVDDIGFLGGKPGIQEEFLHTFEQLASHGRQMVVTADVHPRLLSKVSEELVTRFLSGMVCRLEAPDAHTRNAIVHHKAAGLSTKINQSALDYVARRFVQNVREIEGALNTLETWYAMTGKAVTLQTARQVLSDLERDCIRVIRLEDIESAVCGLFGVASDDLKSNRRTRSVSQPRMLAMFLARRHTQAAYKEIGSFFGGRNHSTVVAAEKKVEVWLQSHEALSIGGRQWHLTDVIDSLEQQLLAG